MLQRRYDRQSVQPRREFRRIAEPVAELHGGRCQILKNLVDGLRLADARQYHGSQPLPVRSQFRLPIDTTGRGRRWPLAGVGECHG